MAELQESQEFQESQESQESQRRTFGPVVLLGLAGSGLAAWAGTRNWVTLSVPDGEQIMGGVPASSSPAATSLALVALACWGVLLVTRRVVRRIVAVLAAVAAAGTGLTLLGLGGLQDHVARTAVTSGDVQELGYTAWPWVTLVGAVAALVAALAAVLVVPSWPEMGKRYDAPTGQEASSAPVEEQSSLDLWTSIGEGHDPTADRTE